MELKQLQLGDKVKMKLIQPKIKCSGRDTVECFYRGKIIHVPKFNAYLIEFKFKGKIIRDWYYINFGFRNKELKDIKII